MKFQVLLVDDDLMSRKLMAHFLAPLQLDYQCLASGQECLDSLAQQTPALILMDCQMPEMDGFETTRRLRQSGYQGPIWALSADQDPASLQRCLDSGMNAHFAKPVQAQALREAIARLQLPDPLERVHSLAQASGRPELVQTLVATFLKTTEALMEELVQSKDSQTRAALLHRLRGSAGSFGAQELAQLAASTPLDGDIQALKECWQSLRNRLR